MYFGFEICLIYTLGCKKSEVFYLELKKNNFLYFQPFSYIICSKSEHFH